MRGTDELMEKKVIEDVKEKSEYLMERLEELQKKYPAIQQIRGIGLMIGLCLIVRSKRS